jgi:hypothetical protein
VNYSIYKNGTQATLRDLRKYDVATYDATTNSVRVCDTRVSVYYESCSPNPQAPESIHVLGRDFDVLPTAMDSVAKFKPGQQMTILLTEGGQVAGAVEATASVARTNAVGIVRNGRVQMICGTAQIEIDTGDAAKTDGQLVRIATTSKNTVTLSNLTGGFSGTLNVTAKTLGSKELTDNVMIFRDGESLSLSDLTSAEIPSSQIVYARANWADKIDLIVLSDNGTGTMFYGRAIFEEGDTTTDDEETGETVTIHGNNKISLVAGNNTTYGPYETGYTAYNGECLGISLTGSGSNKRIGSLVRLTALKDVPNSAWTSQRAVTVNGKQYTVPSNVLCYNLQTKGWVTLAEAHAYATVSTLYVYDGVVRIIEVG